MARILIVEDDAEMARLVSGLLSEDGHDITITPNGLDALEMLRARPVDLLLLDVNVPGCDGIEVCRRARVRELSDARTTIVMITGRHDTASKLLAFSVGADDYLVKPIDVRELRSRVARWVDSRSQQAELVVRRRRDAIREIVAAICHEVNNPLTAAVIGVDLVIERGVLDGQAMQDLETVRASLQRIDEVVSALASVQDRTVSYVGDQKMIDLKGSF
ncbi:MAG: response regulator [Acidobacteriota bacterium]|nr:response regulator [Acidobacteriota bacterium]